MHCLESVAWWSAAAGASDGARQLLGLAAGIRNAHKRKLHWLESYPHRAAIELCGVPDDLDPEDADLHHTIELALRLLDTDTEDTSTRQYEPSRTEPEVPPASVSTHHPPLDRV